MSSFYIFAQTYSAGSYGSSVYSSSTTTSSSGSTGSTGSSQGTLTNTGFDILLAASLACAIIFAALVVRFWKRPASVRKED